MGPTLNERMFGATCACCGVLMALFAFLPWFDFGSSSVSGVNLPELEGELFFAFSLAIGCTGFAMVWRHNPLPLFVTFLSGITAFAVCAQQVLTDWQAGACFGPAPTDNFICTVDYSGTDMFISWTAVGSPAAALWAATGLSAFVSLLAAWRLFARPPQSSPEAPIEISEAWA